MLTEASDTLHELPMCVHIYLLHLHQLKVKGNTSIHLKKCRLGYVPGFIVAVDC